MNIALVSDVPGESEVADLQLVRFAADEQVLRFNIPVHHVLAMEIVDSLQELVDKELNALSVEAVWLFLEYLE